MQGEQAGWLFRLGRDLLVGSGSNRFALPGRRRRLIPGLIYRLFRRHRRGGRLLVAESRTTLGEVRHEQTQPHQESPGLPSRIGHVPIR